MMKRLAFPLLWCATLAQIVWLAYARFQLGLRWTALAYPIAVTAGFVLFAVARDRWRILPALLRMFIGLAFVSAICDRFGLFGRPGAPGVSWGDFRHFVAYTAQVNAFLPAAVIPALAVGESVIEGGLGLMMLLGIATRKSNIASAALLASFGIAMTVSLGASAQFAFAVFVLAAGAAALAAVDSSMFSLEALRRRIGGAAESAPPRAKREEP